MVSVCASRDAGPNKGYVQYRFGKPDSAEPLELLLPESQLPPSRVAYGGTEAFSGGGGAWIAFTKGQIVYTAYTGIGKWGPGGAIRDAAGVAVEQRGKRLATLKCDNPKNVLGDLGPDWLDKVGVKRGGPEYGFPEQ
jgi:hypothetical protein